MGARNSAVRIAVPGHLLYSTNPFIKLLIQERFRKDIHFVWCSETFDSTKHPAYSGASLTAPSSDPCAIYRLLAEDCKRADKHSAKIISTRSSLVSLSSKWRQAGEITSEEEEEIVYMANLSDQVLWRPLVYVIPRALVAPRLKLVPPSERASTGVEYTIANLARNEFDIVEI